MSHTNFTLRAYGIVGLTVIMLLAIAASAPASPARRSPRTHRIRTDRTQTRRTQTRRTPTLAAEAGSDLLDPSGVPMPVGNIAGWRQVFADDFSGTSLSSCWGTYQGIPGGAPTTLLEPSHVVVGGGMAQLESYRDPGYGDRWVSAGMSSAPCLRQTYGKYEVRFKMNPADGVKYTILLWPSTVPWPCGGEIDFGEDGGGDRSSTQLTVHYCTPPNTDTMLLPEHTISAQFGRWHTLGVEWLPGSLSWTMDGRTIVTLSSQHIPANPMELDMQTESNTNCTLPYFSCVDSSTPPRVSLDIAWAVAYAPA